MMQHLFSVDSRDMSLIGTDIDAIDRQSLIWALSTAIGVLIASIAWWQWRGSPSLAMTVLGVGAVVMAWWHPRRAVKERAARIRADMDLAVSVFLDLVNVLLAGGAGVETAMLAAASSGDGWAFEQIRLALARAQSARHGYWDELRELGLRIGVDSLVEVAHSVQLAGDHGAKIRASLVSKSRALRGRNLARIEHDAERRTEQMGLPLVVMFMGFLILIGYPAFAGTVGAL